MPTKNSFNNDKVHLEKLKEELAAGKITKDEFWDAQNTQEANQGNEADVNGGLSNLFFVSYKTLFTLLPILAGVLILYFVFIYNPPPQGIDFRVHGAGVLPATAKEKESIYRGLFLIKENSLSDYEFVDRHVNTIDVSGPVGFSLLGSIRGSYQGGGEGFKNILIVRDFSCLIHCNESKWNGADMLTAEFIIHEACHSMQHHKNLSFSEPECYEMQFEFAREVGPKLWADFKEEYFVYDYELMD